MPTYSVPTVPTGVVLVFANIDGGSPGTVAFAQTLDGGAPGTVVFDGVVNGGGPYDSH
jgi:hypothetical protein